MNLSNESKVGIFAAVGIAVFIIGYNYMKGKDLFSSTNSYYAVFETVDGLVASNPVMINGHRIGQVREVKLQKGEGYSLMVKIDVTGDIEVPKNSTIKVYSADFFGSKAVELVLGDENEMANDGDTLQAFLEPGLTENLNSITAPLREKIASILSGLDSTFNGPSGAALREAMAQLPGTIDNIDGTISTIKHTTEYRIAALLDNAVAIEKMILENEDNLRSAISNLNTFSDTLKALEIQQTIQRANQVLESLDVTIQNINEGKGTLGQLATNRSLYDSVEKVSVDLDKLIQNINAKPLRFFLFGKQTVK